MFDSFMNLGDYLEQLFGKKVEILTPEGIKSIPVKAFGNDPVGETLYEFNERRTKRASPLRKGKPASSPSLHQTQGRGVKLLSCKIG